MKRIPYEHHLAHGAVCIYCGRVTRGYAGEKLLKELTCTICAKNLRALEAQSIPHYIYGLFDPRTKQCRYVGRTIKLESRLSSHLKQRNLNTEKGQWLQDLHGMGLKPEMKVLEVSTWENAACDEEKWMLKLIDEGHPLVNEDTISRSSWGGKNNNAIDLKVYRKTGQKISVARDKKARRILR